MSARHAIRPFIPPDQVSGREPSGSARFPDSDPGRESDPAAFRHQLRLLIADRGSPEAAAFYQVLLKYVHRRVINVARTCGGALGDTQIEEIAAEVLLQLMQGALARFRGESPGELYAFVRTIADRSTWRAVRRLERERNLLHGSGPDLVEDFSAPAEAPDRHLELVPDSPLSEADQQYLRDLLLAGSKAELARKAGVSRAAVTQRVQRIRARIDALAPQERMAHDVWMRHAARDALDEAPVDADFDRAQVG